MPAASKRPWARLELTRGGMDVVCGGGYLAAPATPRGESKRRDGEGVPTAARRSTRPPHPAALSPLMKAP
jgi:hypothetical protein